MKNSLFSEHRLLSRTVEELNAQRKAVGASSALTQSQNRAALVTEQNRRNTIRTNVAERDRLERVGSGDGFNARSLGVTKDNYNQGKLPIKVTTPSGKSKVVYDSSQQKRSIERGQKEGAAVEKYSNWYNDQIKQYGFVDPEQDRMAQESRDSELSVLGETFAMNDQANQEARQARKDARKDISTPITGSSKTATSSRQPFGNRTSNVGKAVNVLGKMQLGKMTRAQRLGLAPKTSSQPLAPGATSAPVQGGGATSVPIPADATTPQPAGTAPVITTPTDIPSDEVETYTGRQAEAAGALDSDTLDAPNSLTQMRAEEMAAADPTLDAIAASRASFKIYQQGAQAQIDDRGKQIEDYKNSSIDRSEQTADAKIQQSKANRDLDIELLNESRDRAERDQLIAQDKTDRDYQREEDRIIGENKTKLQRMETALGSRYGGFGSGKGLQRIQEAADEGSEVLRQLNEDKVYARQESQTKLQDIEDKWNSSRQVIFNQHDQNVTNAYTKMMEEAQAIDDNALTEEGDQIDASVTLLKETFTQFDKMWTATGEALSTANKNALTRRDAVRKEQYEQSQDALTNIFSGLSNLPSNSPFFTDLEKKAGMTPGTIASTHSNEERRIAVSEASLRISQSELGLQLKKFERDGNQIDPSVSKLLGHMVTSDGKIFRDYFGNPVNLVGENGAVTTQAYNDKLLYGQDTVGTSSAANFSRYAMQIGDLVPGSPYHKGGEYDIDGKAGTPIPVWNSGQVVAVNQDPNGDYGIYVDVFDGQNTTRYAHLQQANVKMGQSVSGVNSGQSQLIGVMGNTGNVLGMDGQHPQVGDGETGSHLHLEVRKGNSFDAGERIDAMDVGMVPGMMQSGKIVWVDNMRKKMQQGQPIGSSAKGGSIYSSINTPWQQVDQQILELAKDVFKTPEGKSDQKALDLVYDYMLQNKMGDYQLNYSGGTSAFQDRQIEDTAFQDDLARRVQSRVVSGEDPMDIYNATIEAGKVGFLGKQYDVTPDILINAFSKAGYKYEKGSWVNFLPGGKPLNDRFSRLTSE